MAKTIFVKILEAIFGEFKSNWPSFVAKLIDKVPDDVRKKVSIGIKIVDKMKTWLGGDVAKFITHIIPGDIDETLRLSLIAICEKVLDLDKSINNVTGGEISASSAHVIASELNAEITGMTFGQSALTTEVVYQDLKKNGEVA